MAKTVRPLNSVAASGSLGGLTYSAHRGTNIVKKKSAPVKPHTSKQLFNQQLMTQISQAWQSLSADQRHMWDLLSSNNKSGYSIFSERNYIRSMAYSFFNLLAVPVNSVLPSGFLFDWYFSMDDVYVDSGFYINRPWFCEARVMFGTYEGRKLTPKQCRTTNIFRAFPPDIISVFSQTLPGAAVLHYRFIDGQSGCTSSWTQLNFIIDPELSQLFKIGDLDNVYSIEQLRVSRSADTERLLQLYPDELSSIESI